MMSTGVSERPSLLVIDDDEVLRERLVRAFRERGYDSVGAANGDDALVLAATDPPELAVVPRRNPWFADLSPDGRDVVFNGIATVNFDLESVSLDSTHEARVLSASPTAIEAQGRFSPDGRWVAYQSDESGRSEVYIRRFREAGGRVQISVAGGRRAIWGNGTLLYYWEGNRLIAASLSFAPSPAVVSRTPLFAGRYEDDYDVSKDGTRFLMIESDVSGLGLVVIPNWRTELRRLGARADR